MGSWKVRFRGRRLAGAARLPFDAAEFAREALGRKGIELVVTESTDLVGAIGEGCGITGVALLGTDTAATIMLSPRLDGLHREHVILHELAHLLFEHPGSAQTELSDRQADQLFGSLFMADQVRDLLANPNYARGGPLTRQEREAEAFATEVLSKVQARSGEAHDKRTRIYGFGG